MSDVSVAVQAQPASAGSEAAQPIAWGIVGCGDVTEVKSGPALQKAHGSRLAAVMRRDGDKARDFAQRHGVPRWTDDAAELIHGSDVDAVYVATPPASHLEYARMAAAAGKPVYVEKPMATSLHEANAMRAACAQAGVPLFVAYYRRALPRFERVRELIERDAIGTPRTVRATLTHSVGPAERDAHREGWRFDPEIAGGGLLMDLGSHALDLLDHWFGPVTEVSGHATAVQPGGRVEDEVSARFVFAGGVHGVGLWSFQGGAEIDEILVVGSHGWISVPLFADGAVRWSGRDGAEHQETIAHPAHVQQPLIQQLVDELRGVGGPAASNGRSAARTQAVLDALLHGQRWRRAFTL